MNIFSCFIIFILFISGTPTIAVIEDEAAENFIPTKRPKWSDWSECNIHCAQSRNKPCQRRNPLTTRVNRKCFGNDRQYQMRICDNCTPGTKSLRDLVFGAESSLNEVIFSHWTRWSPCSKKTCTQIRAKICKIRQLCADRLLTESRVCSLDCFLGDKEPLEETSTTAPANIEKEELPKHIHNPDEDVVDKEAAFHSEEDEENEVLGTGSSDDSHSNFTCGVPTHTLQFRIMGGSPSLKGAWPWQAMILDRNFDPYCGGTLISPLWILTAAHCVQKRMYAILGEHDVDSVENSEQRFFVKAAIVHRKFSYSSINHDIAMLRLSRPARLTRHVIPACLPKPEEDLQAGHRCKILGWGKETSQDLEGTTILRQADMTIRHPELCEAKFYEFRITEKMFCAGDVSRKIDTCSGDSGGPLLCRDEADGEERPYPWAIYGITSFGETCESRGKLGVYTRVSRYLHWIKDVIRTYS